MTVGARRPVHGLQFNGKQEDVPRRTSNLRCPRNGKQTGLYSIEDPAFILNHWTPLKQVTGKVMKVALSARIPANKVEVRRKTHF